MALNVSPAAVSNGSRSAYSRRGNVLTNIDGVPNSSPNIASWSTPPGGTQTSGPADSCPSPNIRPHTQGTRSPQWSRCQCETTIEASCGQPPSRSRSLVSTPGPQSSSNRPVPSTTYPEWAPPGLGQAGEQPTTVRRTAVYCRPDGSEDSCSDCQARPRRPRPGCEDHRPGPARRRHGGDLHGPPPDARADRRDRDPGRRGRRWDLDPFRSAHDPRPADPRSLARERRRGRPGGARRDDSE